MKLKLVMYQETFSWHTFIYMRSPQIIGRREEIRGWKGDPELLCPKYSLIFRAEQGNAFCKQEKKILL